MLTIALVWYALGLATMSLYASWGDELTPGDVAWCLAVAPWFWGRSLTLLVLMALEAGTVLLAERACGSAADVAGP